MTAGVGVAGRTSSLLEPGNEGLDSEGLGELASTAGRSRCGLSSGGGLSDDGGSRGSSGGGGGSGGSGRSGGGSGGSAVASGGGSGGGARAGARAASPESRAGDGVVDAAAVGVEDDILDGVEAGADNTLGGLGSGTGDLNVQAL